MSFVTIFRGAFFFLYALFSLVGYIIFQLNISVDEKETALRQQQELRLLGEQLAKGSDYLTAEVRNYVQFGNKLHYDNFWVEVDKTRSRDIAVERLKKLKALPEELEFIENAKRYSDGLIVTEKLAMEYMKIGDTDGARALVFGEYYLEQKKLIMENIKIFQDLINKRALEHTRKADSKAKVLTSITILLLVLSGLLVLFFFYFIGIKQLVEPLKSLTNLMLKMAEGDLGLNIPVASKSGSNEIYEMASTLDFFQNNLIKRYENERLLDIVANNTTSVIYFKDKEGRYLFTNEHWKKLFCKSNEEVKGKTDFDIFPKDFAEKFVKNDKEVFESGITFNGEEIAPHGDVIHTYISSKVPLLDAEGKIYGLCGISTDITEIKNTEKRVEKERQKFFNMLDQLPVCFHLQASDYSIPFANKMFRERFGDTENKKCYQAIHMREISCDPCSTFRAFDSQKTESNIWNSSDGKTYMSVVTPFDDLHGEKLLMEMSIDISEEKRFEESLAVSERQFKTIFEESPLGIALIESLTGKMMQVNNHFSEIAGRSKSELKGLTWMDLTISEDIDTDLQNYKNLNSGKIDSYNIEKRYIKADGEEGWVHKRVTKVSMEDNKNVHLAMILDITERKKSQESLAISEKQFRTIFEESPLGVALIDSLTGQIYGVNRKFADIAGRSLSEMENIDWMSITHPDDIQEDLDNMAALNAGKITGFNMEKRYIKLDGFYVWISMTISPLTVEDKSSPRHLCMIEDITEKKKNEKDLTRFGRVLSSSSNEIYMFSSTTFKFIQVNLGACENLGYSMDELSQLTPLDIKPNHNFETFEELIKPLREQKEIKVAFETVHQRKDKSLYPVNVNLQLIHEESPPLFVAIIEDITKRKKVENELKDYQNNLEGEINRRTAELKNSQDQLIHSEKLSTLGAFAGTVAHEFNNPLFGLINLVDQLGDELKEEDRKKYSKIAQKECWRMADMVKNLQSFYKPSDEIFSKTNMSLLLEEVLLIIAKTCGNKGIKIIRKYSDDKFLFEGIEDQIKQVLLNVLQNAIDSISGEGEITLNLAKSSKQIIVEIIDTGQGIDKKSQKFIFDPFYTTKGKKGTGLGLSVSYGIVKSHGGQIVFESDLNIGSTVTLVLPISRKV
ncbi:PAS domain S-box protein [Nitrospinaceae bacterium]|nr:PAS domain S-box protein [Nitrospinaceae bacterium]